MPTSALPLFVALSLVVAIGCAGNDPWRVTINDSGQCERGNGRSGLIDETLGPYASMAFVEFTERGNLFDRRCVEEVYQYLEEEIADPDNGGVAIIIFIHGWKHNASREDGNVRDFRRMLKLASDTLERPIAKGSLDAVRRRPFQAALEPDATRPRKLIGVYVGWRGLSLKWPMNITYWDRKSVAQEVGKGGVTEVLLSLERISRCGSFDLYDECEADSRNVYVVVGHSFGGAIVLSALNEVLLNRIIEAKPAGPSRIVTDGLGEGVLLLNPAIEVNEGFQVRELINRFKFDKQQDILLHVISSAADTATHGAFPLGQWVGALTWNERKVPRRLGTGFRCEPFGVEFDEHDLLTTTIGNYAPFWTGLLYRSEDSWGYVALTDGRAGRSARLERAIQHESSFARVLDRPHICAPRHSPVQVIHTDPGFISDHNDVFNPQVVAYTAAIVGESLAITKGRPVPAACLKGPDGSFEFGGCFRHYFEMMK